MSSLIDWIMSVGEVERNRFGVQLFRVIAGLAVLFELSIIIAQGDLFFGAGAIYPVTSVASGFGVSNFSYFALLRSPAWQWFCYFVTLATVVVWISGRGGWAVAIGVAWAVHSFHARMPGLWDGGDNILEIILVYAVLINVGSGKRAPGIGVVLHNFGLLACGLQVALVYFAAGLAKVPGEYWTNGTAFYYVLASAEFGSPARYIVERSTFLLALLTWSPLVLQLAFPWLVFFGRPWAKRMAVSAAVVFHFGIFLLMGLTTFAAIMIAAEMMLLSDDDFVALRRFCARAWWIGPRNEL